MNYSRKDSLLNWSGQGLKTYPGVVCGMSRGHQPISFAEIVKLCCATTPCT